jgi:tetratricopeptide (TPR) repeat protein
MFNRLLITAALGWLMVVLFLHARETMAAEQTDPTRTILLFGGVVLTGLAIGAVVALSFIPALGDWFASLFFNPEEEVEKDPHAAAMACIAQGDYPGAIQEYRARLAAEPGDILARTEISRIYCERLGDPEAGAEVIESALDHEWEPEQSAQLCNRLVDIYLQYFNDRARARAVLTQLAEALPDTKYAANAVHRMHEIDRAELGA